MEKAITILRSLSTAFLLIFLSLQAVWAQDDVIQNVVVPQSPKTPSAFLEVLESAGLRPNFHAVANRGACNPRKGSFSIFGDVGPELTFGIFVEPSDSGELVLQESLETRLLIEVIVEDKHTGMKNFWELIGEGDDSNWHYRGNSLDVLADIEEINMRPTQKAVFGNRLRCSGCHTGGDLVMKELFPYNDWQSDSPLSTGPFRASERVREIYDGAKSAHHLSEVVKESLARYVKSLETRSPETTKQWTRSLLAPLEMNLASDLKPFQARLLDGSDVEIPSTFFVDPLLSGPQKPVKVPLAVYHRALRELGSEFAPDETSGLIETQHAFLVPVRSKFDTLRVKSLIRRGLLDEELVSDFLAVDYQQPMYSEKRLQLMTLLPDNWSSVKELKTALQKDNFPRQARNRTGHQKVAVQYLERIRSDASSLESVKAWLLLADKRRRQIQGAQTSQNPRGAILEGGLGSEGFRRIFPQYSKQMK